MKVFFNRLKRDGGFTLVELMVVVAIIGLLSAVAIPNFRKYQAKSKTSEAKLQLAASYSALVSFYSDYDYYGSCLNLMGYDPSNEVATRYFAVGFATSFASSSAVTNGAPDGCSASQAQTNAALSAGTVGYYTFGASKSFNGSSTPATWVTSGITTAVAANNTFIVGAVGIVDRNYNASGTAAAFTINEAKFLKQLRAGY